MFNYNAQQVFVLQPVNTGGGLLSFLLSLETKTATLDLKCASINEKINNWNNYTNPTATVTHAHLYGDINIGKPDHQMCIDQGEYADRYIHKCHFYELFSPENQQLVASLGSNKVSIGIHLTPGCVDTLQKIRVNTPLIDLYQLWMYNNQQKLLHDFWNIKSIHAFPFIDMLDTTRLLDHVSYCRELLSLDLNLDLCKNIIQAWQQKIIRNTVI
jgi:hypothetical protein